MGFDKLYENIVSDENIEKAYKKCLMARKKWQRGRYIHRKEKYICKARGILKSVTWNVRYNEPYIINDSGKDRTIVTCSFSDKIVQEAIRGNLERMYIKRYFIQNTFQSIKGRGAHSAVKMIGHKIRSIANANNSKRAYVLHIDVKKYYESIDSKILYQKLKYGIYSKKILSLLKQLLNGNEFASGCVLGNSLSQFFGNVYLSEIDHKYNNMQDVSYFRYADDMILISHEKSILYELKDKIVADINALNLFCRYKFIEVSDTNGFNTLGYIFFKDKTRSRKKTKGRFLNKSQQGGDTSSYLGHLKYCNGQELINKGKSLNKTRS